MDDHDAIQKPLLENEVTATGNGGKRLCMRDKLGYAVAGSGVYLVALVRGIFLTPFLLEVVGMEPFWAGAILLVGNVWDALSDPVIGALSDATRTTHGRRIPWMLWASVPYGITYFFLWMTPPYHAMWVIIAAFFLLYITNTTLQTMINVPYRALMPQITSDYDQRTTLASYRGAGCMIAMISAVVVQALLVEGFHDANYSTVQNYQFGYFFAACAIAPTAVILTVAGAFLIRSHDKLPQVEEEQFSHGGAKAFKRLIKQFVKQTITALQNKPFLIIILVQLCLGVVVAVISNNLFLYLKYVIEKEKYLPVLLPLMMGTAFLTFPMWTWACHRFNKKKAYYAEVVVMVLATAPWTFLPKGDIGLYCFFPVALVCGVAISGGLLIPSAMLPDVIELDEALTGQRREGVFYSVFLIVEKIAAAASVALATWVLGLCGYISPDSVPSSQQSDVDQPDAVLYALRLMTGLVPSVVLAISFVPVYFFPITKESHVQILKAIEQRKNLRKDLFSEDESDSEDDVKRKDNAELLDGAPLSGRLHTSGTLAIDSDREYATLGD